MTPQTATRGKQLFETGSNRKIQMRSVAQMGGKNLGNLGKRSAEQIRGKELRSLIKMISKNKHQLPLVFVVGGISKLTQTNLLPDIERDDSQDIEKVGYHKEQSKENLSKDNVD